MPYSKSYKKEFFFFYITDNSTTKTIKFDVINELSKAFTASEDVSTHPSSELSHSDTKLTPFGEGT
jgi:hypothetical protein